MRIILVAAVYGLRWGIGFKGKLPWGKNLADMKHFAKITRGKVVIMGSNTWRSIPTGLPGRKCLVLSSNVNSIEGEAIQIPSVEEALGYAKDTLNAKEVYVIGGESIYRQFLPMAQEVILSKIPDVDTNSSLMFDTFFPHLPRDEWEITCIERKPGIQPGFTNCLLVENWERVKDV